MQKFEKIFSPVNLLILNIVIIVGAFATGDFFEETGIIHGFALLFILLSLVRIFVHYYSYDQFLEKFFHAATLTFIIFALSHFVEFFSYQVLDLYNEVTFINVVNFYILGLLILIIGSERFLRLYDNRSAVLIWILSVVAAAVAVPIVGLYFKEDLVSTEADSVWFYLYILVAVVVAVVAIWKMYRIGKLVSISSKFTTYMVSAVILVTVSIFIELFYDFLIEASLKTYQIVYISHFFFYGGMSLTFLAFGTLEDLKNKGIYREVQRLKDEDAIKNIT